MAHRPAALSINSERLHNNFDELSQIGANEKGGITRFALSGDDLKARYWFAEKVESIGLQVRDDDVGNLSGVLPASIATDRTILVGSHLDTVQNGGRYDGSIGVLAGLECLQCIHESGIELPVNLEVIDFTDEEGTWQSFFGSLGLTGGLEASHLNDAQQDNAGFRAALQRAGILPREVQRARRDPATLLAYLELHIEQSSTLDRTGTNIGIVDDIVGRASYNLYFQGRAAHAATTRPEDRRDALQGAADFITQMHLMVKERFPHGVANCGQVSVEPGKFSVVPAEVLLQIECRHVDTERLEMMRADILALARRCAHEHSLTVASECVLYRPVAHMDTALRTSIAESCRALGYTYASVPSYAGHDAQILSRQTPSAMIFIPSRDGISHNPDEFTEWEDVERGASVLLDVLLRLVGDIQPAKRMDDPLSADIR